MYGLRHVIFIYKDICIDRYHNLYCNICFCNTNVAEVINMRMSGKRNAKKKKLLKLMMFNHGTSCAYQIAPIYFKAYSGLHL